MARFNDFFPAWALLAALLAYLQPGLFQSLGGLIVPGLSLIMFCMGLTLEVADFRRVLALPRAIGIGVALQFLLMPLAAWTIAQVLSLPEQLAAGLILVGCCAGGTASNVICYLARGDVALSISMTLVSTLLGVVLTPFLCWLYIDQAIEVDYLSMLLSIVKMVLLPVLAGLLLNHYLRSGVDRVRAVLPSIAIITICLLIAIIVALNASRLAQLGPLLVLAVILHNSLGYLGAYGASRLLGMDVLRSRTIAIEVGMQNSGLGVALAVQYFSAAAALPGALFSVWHNLSGSLLAAWWSRREAELAPGQG